MNQLNAIGNTGSDASIAYTAGGDAILNFSFALNSGYGDKAVTSWLNCSLFGKRAETLAPMILKGQRIGITGEIVNRKYTAKDGTEKYSLDCRLSNVTLLGGKGEASAHPTTENAPKANSASPGTEFDEFDEVPF